MLGYKPSEKGQLYLFDNDSRHLTKKSLLEDIPEFIAKSGDAITIHEFYATAYSETPAHTEDIHKAIIEHPDIEVLTKKGGERRVHTTIKTTDILKLKNQKSFFFMFTGKTAQDEK